MVRVWPQCWQVVGGPRDKIWDFVALVWPSRGPVITTSSVLVRRWNFLGGPSVGSTRYRSLTMYRYIPFGLNLPFDVRVY